ncbi:plasmid replication initiator TrfA [Hymenobacter sp. HDW8]|uniref:plasmid replication initiator TrfA n=1 Tax=Hymenobacter sp. HDW8 TaxID=2714932 RepID=UPI00140E415A|nr:hypothetical protein G7064_14790 [Hymenobacter sp. HDW8]
MCTGKRCASSIHRFRWQVKKRSDAKSAYLVSFFTSVVVLAAGVFLFVFLWWRWRKVAPFISPRFYENFFAFAPICPLHLAPAPVGRICRAQA